MTRTALNESLVAQLALLDTLRQALYTANSLDGMHAVQAGYAFNTEDGTYGMISKALVRGLEITLRDQGIANPEHVAEVLYYKAIDNGESITYQYNLMLDGILDI